MKHLWQSYFQKTQHQRMAYVLGGWIVLCAYLCFKFTTLVTPISDHAAPSSMISSAFKGAPLFTDRNGVCIAGLIPSFSLYADAHHIKQAQKTAHALKRLFPEINDEKLQKRLSSHKRFVWIKRHLTPTQRNCILKLGIPGLYLTQEKRRVYPQNNLFSHIIGIRDVDGRPLSGLERFLNQTLSQNTTIRTSLDSRIQHIVRDELQKAMTYHEAPKGNALLMKVDTGEVVAMVSLPDFDPHKPGKSPIHHHFNRNTMGVYEFGSVLKIHNVAMALENKIAHLGSVYDASTPMRLGRFTIRDVFRPTQHPLTLREAFLRSSNIANAKLAMDAGVNRQQDFFEKVGLFDCLKHEAPEVSKPLRPSIWRTSTLATASYGYGFAVTPLHMVRSLARIVTGKKITTHFTAQSPSNISRFPTLLKPNTTKHMRTLLRQVVLEGGSKKAHIPGYLIGAKTGTANLLKAAIGTKNTYQEGQNLVSCVGVFPINKPLYILLVSLEHPKPKAENHGYTTAGWVAAPLLRQVLQKILPILGIKPHISQNSANS